MMIEEDPKYCPIMDILCPQGEKKASECRLRYQEGYDPIRSIRDFGILCCSYQRYEEMENDTPKV